MSLLFYSQSGKILDLIDLPGHEKLRTRFLEQYKDQARSVVSIAKDREPKSTTPVTAELSWCVQSGKLRRVKNKINFVKGPGIGVIGIVLLCHFCLVACSLARKT